MVETSVVIEERPWGIGLLGEYLAARILRYAPAPHVLCLQKLPNAFHGMTCCRDSAMSEGVTFMFACTAIHTVMGLLGPKTDSQVNK